jgi:hypothetical protein
MSNVDLARHGWPRAAALAFVVASAAALGWIAHGVHVASRPLGAVVLARPRPAAVALDADQTLIAVASDGRVTLRVEQQPLQWVLEQIAEQAQWPELAAAVGIDIGSSPGAHEPTRAAASAAPTVPAAPTAPTAPAPAAMPNAQATIAASPRAATAVPPGAAPVDAAQVKRLLASAGETQRLDGLARARAGGLRLDERTLQLLFEGDPSEHVRMAAFETYLSMHADSRDDLRDALRQAMHLPSPRIRHDAQLRLEALDALERNAPSTSDDP